MRKSDFQYINQTLVNDEASSDDEMLILFMEECNIGANEAAFYVNQRKEALLHPLHFSVIPFNGESVTGFPTVHDISVSWLSYQKQPFVSGWISDPLSPTGKATVWLLTNGTWTRQDGHPDASIRLGVWTPPLPTNATVT